MSLDRFRDAVTKFEVGNPIKSLFKPKFEVIYDFGRDKSKVTVSINSPCSIHPGRIACVHLDEEIPNVLKDSAISRAPNYTEHVAEFLRKMLNKVLQHEIDESISVNGERIFDPHRFEVPIPGTMFAQQIQKDFPA